VPNELDDGCAAMAGRNGEIGRIAHDQGA